MTALCQCVKCERYLAHNRLDDTSYLNSCCVECAGPSAIPLAKIRGTLQGPRSLEVLALLSEECAEVIQRKEKITRWGWDADFEGTTQRHKLEVELGDVVANLILAFREDVVDLVEVLRAAERKLQKYRDDVAGPRQRLLHATPPVASAYTLLSAAALSAAVKDRSE